MLVLLKNSRTGDGRMSVATAEQAALGAVDDYSLYKFVTQDIPSSRQFHVFEAPKLMLDMVYKVAGFAGTTIEPVSNALGKVVDAENFVFFLQDLAALPGLTSNLKERVSGWMKGNTTLQDVANSVRKLGAQIFSTIGDYAGSIRALKNGLNVSVGPFDFVSDRLGNWGSLLGSSSKLYDYLSGDVEKKETSLKPSLQGVIEPLQASKNFWDAAMHVSIIAISVIGLTWGILASPVSVTLLSTSILGSRLMSFYRNCQMKAVEGTRPQEQTLKRLAVGA